ncbi:hypothetical protein HDU76_011215 [Blyttiomyces sp. JEL0837]|nr:hypothetical protein HDU76_011215 [Blyttiomyces sp. JEL0837]
MTSQKNKWPNTDILINSPKPTFHNGLKFVQSRELYHRLVNCSHGWTDELLDWWKDANPFGLFIMACSIGHVELVKDLLVTVTNSDDEDQYDVFQEAMENAARFGYLDVIKVLFEAGDGDVRIDVAHNNFAGLMQKAVPNGHADVVSFLLDKCQPSWNTLPERSKVFFFKFACEYGHADVVKVLNTVVEVEMFSEDDQKAEVLKYAVESRKVDLVKYLVDVGFNDAVSCRDAFLHAVRIEFLGGVVVLANVKGVDVVAGRELAKECGHEEIVKMLSRGI